MKRLVMLLALLVTTGIAHAGGPVAYSSFTLTNDSALLRIVGSTNTIAQTLTAVIVSSASNAGGFLKIYNSTWTTAGQVAFVNTNVTGYYPFSDTVMKGIFYVTSGNTGGVTIIYKY